MAADTPPPSAVDFTGTPLSVGDRVAFILVFDSEPGLYSGRIALIGKDQVCVERGTLYVVRGQQWKPSGMPERIRYATIMRRPEEDG